MIGGRSEPKLTLGLSLSESSDKHGLFRLDAATGTRTKILFYLKHSHLLNYQSIRALLYNSQKHCNFKHSLLLSYQRVLEFCCTMHMKVVRWKFFLANNQLTYWNWPFKIWNLNHAKSKPKNVQILSGIQIWAFKFRAPTEKWKCLP